MINIIRPDKPLNELKHPCKLCEAIRQAHADFMRKIGLMPGVKNIVRNPEPPTSKITAWDNRK